MEPQTADLFSVLSVKQHASDFIFILESQSSALSWLFLLILLIYLYLFLDGTFLEGSEPLPVQGSWRPHPSVAADLHSLQVVQPVASGSGSALQPCWGGD